MKKITIIVLCFLMMLFLVSCKNNEEDLKGKITEEISYLDCKVINMINKLNNITLENYSIVYNKIELQEDTEDSKTGQTGNGQSKSQGQSQNQSSSQEKTEEQGNNSVTTTELKTETILGTNNDNIDWEALEEEIEVLNTSWSVILLDLYSQNVENTEILGFSDKLNNVIISIENRDKMGTLISLRDLYSYIPIFIEMSGIGDENKKIKTAKLHILNAYVSVDEENWDNVNQELINCEVEFNKLANNLEYSQDKEYKVNKIYVLIKEIQNSTSTRDKKLFYMKYKNLLQSINSI